MLARIRRYVSRIFSRFAADNYAKRQTTKCVLSRVFNQIRGRGSRTRLGKWRTYNETASVTSYLKISSVDDLDLETRLNTP